MSVKDGMHDTLCVFLIAQHFIFEVDRSHAQITDAFNASELEIFLGDWLFMLFMTVSVIFMTQSLLSIILSFSVMSHLL